MYDPRSYSKCLLAHHSPVRVILYQTNKDKNASSPIDKPFRHDPTPSNGDNDNDTFDRSYFDNDGFGGHDWKAGLVTIALIKINNL
jgi:hypothetical protein